MTKLKDKPHTIHHSLPSFIYVDELLIDINTCQPTAKFMVPLWMQPIYVPIDMLEMEIKHLLAYHRIGLLQYSSEVSTAFVEDFFTTFPTRVNIDETN